MRRTHADLLMLLIAAIWGLAFVFQKTAMSVVAPLVFVACRTAVATLVMTPLAIAEARRYPGRATMAFSAQAVAAGTAFFVAAWLQQEGLKTATVTAAGFLTALYVVFVPFAAWAMMRRRPTSDVWIAILIAMAGLWLLAGGPFGALSRGDMLVTLSALPLALQITLTGMNARHGRPATHVAIQFATTALLALLFALLLEPISLSAIHAALPQILFTGVLSTALTFTLMTIAMRHTPPSEAAILMSTETLFAALAGAILLGERLPASGWFGAVLILLAILIVQARAWLAEHRAAQRHPRAPT